MKKNKTKLVFLWFILCITLALAGCAGTGNKRGDDGTEEGNRTPSVKNSADAKITGQAQTADIASKAKISREGLTRVIAFGDSYSDNGEANRRSAQIVNSENPPQEAMIKPGKVYWNNRYSNGKTAVEILAEQLELPLTNFATGGATTGETNYSGWMDSLGGTGLLGQIQQFENSLGGASADSQALYFIFASANDYFSFMDFHLPGEPEDAADQAADNLKTAVVRLSKLGAEKFLVVNSSDLTLVPYEISMKHEKQAAAFRDEINRRLPGDMEDISKQQGVTVQVFDMQKAGNEIMKHAQSYGLTVLKQPCQPTYPQVREANTEEDSYYFWDEWHYTRAVHRILGEKMYQELE